MPAETLQDDNLRLVLGPAEKRYIERVRRRAWAKVAIGVGLLLIAGLDALAIWLETGPGVFDAPRAASVAMRLALPIVILLSLIPFAAAAHDASKARRYRRDFEAFQRAYARDPDAVEIPASWDVR